MQTYSSKILPCIIKMEIFEGPLDLLLHLIKKHEIDIFDIPVAFITEKYLEYLETMQELQLDIAVEYLEMACTLAQIKSRMLLPQPDEPEEEEQQAQDPREELVRKLLEYKKYKDAAIKLAEKCILGKDTFTSGITLPEQHEKKIVSEVSIFHLLDIVKSIIEKAKERGRSGPQILIDRITVAERINQISDLLKEKKSIAFLSLLDENATTFDIVITFLAILEMVKIRMISVIQNEPFGEIMIIPPIPYPVIIESEREETVSGKKSAATYDETSPLPATDERTLSESKISAKTPDLENAQNGTEKMENQNNNVMQNEISKILEEYLKEK